MSTRSFVHTVFFFIQLLLFNHSNAQQIDSLAVADPRSWIVEEVDSGINWKYGHFKELFRSTQTINILEIDLKQHQQGLQLVGLSDELKTTSELAQGVNAKIAINGGFFDMKNGGAEDFIKIKQEVINYSKKTNARANAIFAFSKTDVNIIPAKDSTLAYEQYSNVLLAGPLLRLDGQSVPLDQNPFNNHRHPRSCIALAGDTLYFITVDGRNAEANGMSLAELQHLMTWLQLPSAMNLDGGGSTTLFIDQHGAEGVVNYPCDNKLFDHHGQRKVANIIAIQ